MNGPCSAGSMLSAPRRTVNPVVLLLLLSGALAAILVVLGVAWRLHRAPQSFPALGARNITAGDRCPECGDGTIRPAGCGSTSSSTFKDYLDASGDIESPDDAALLKVFEADIRLGLQYHDARVARGLTQRQLADLSGYQPH